MVNLINRLYSLIEFNSLVFISDTRVRMIFAILSYRFITSDQLYDTFKRVMTIYTLKLKWKVALVSF